MLRKALVTLVLAGIASVAGAETVYKWMDTAGQVHYTDRPPVEAGSRVLAVYEQGLNAPDEDQGDDQDQDQDDGFDDDTADSPPPMDTVGLPPPSEETVAAVQQDVQRERAEQCTKAQERYKTYVQSQRLFRQTADGGREYLSDAELAQARVRAKQAVDEFCN